MRRSRWSLRFSTALLAGTLAWLGPAAAQESGSEAESEQKDEAALVVETADEADPGDQDAETEKEPIAAEVPLSEIGEVLSPWDSEGIKVHGVRARREGSAIRTHEPGELGDYRTHTGTSGGRSRIPTVRIGVSDDDDIVTHGTGRRGPSRIKVHGHGR